MTEDEQAQQIVIDFKQTFTGGTGEKVLNYLKKRVRFNQAPRPMDNLGRIDPFEVMFIEGRRSVIIEIETMLAKEPGETKGIQDHE